MNEIVISIIRRYFNTEPIQISPLGGGFYGKVFLATLYVKPYKVVVKIYLHSGLALKESSQLKVLAEHSLIPMPEIYGIHISDEAISRDVLMMEYIDGVNAGIQDKMDKACVDLIADRIVDNLVSLHKTSNPEGFGEISSDEFCDDWRLFYKPKVRRIYESARVLHMYGKMDDKTYQIVSEAYQKFDDIFYLPITKSSLIHGDYNTRNVMLNHELSDTLGVIDPFGCCWGDPEYDLYQLNNANGIYLSLLDRYIRKNTVSENFEIKNCFYELFTEIMHYHGADIDIVDSNIPETALKLEALMKKNAI